MNKNITKRYYYRTTNEQKLMKTKINEENKLMKQKINEQKIYEQNFKWTK